MTERYKLQEDKYMATGKSIIKNFNKDSGFEVIPRELLQHCDKSKHGDDGLSLEAIGLLVNLQSYPEDWELNKTELYKRYSKNGRRKIENAWDLLVEKRYIVQFKKRNGKNYDYVYYFSVEPFDEQTVIEIEGEENSKAVLDFKLNKGNTEEILECTNRTLQNEHSILDSPNRTDNIIQTHHNKQKNNTYETNGYSGVHGNQKPTIHSNHASHGNHQPISDEDTAFDYYTDELPKTVKNILKPFKTSEIKLFKNKIRLALKNINADYPEHTIAMADVSAEIESVINKVRFKQKKDDREYSKHETIDQLQPFIYRSFYNAFEDYIQALNIPEDHTDAYTVETNTQKRRLPQKDKKNHTEVKYATEDEELKKIIEEFRGK